MKYKEYEPQTLSNLQATELEILEKIKEICDLNNIGYCLIYGSLIGAVRHQGFIPWDDDMDIAMFRDDYEKFKVIFNQQAGANFYFHTSENTKGYSSAVGRVMKVGTKCIPYCYRKAKFEYGVYIDIFVMDKATHAMKKIKNAGKSVSLSFNASIFNCISNS